MHKKKQILMFFMLTFGISLLTYADKDCQQEKEDKLIILKVKNGDQPSLAANFFNDCLKKGINELICYKMLDEFIFIRIAIIEQQFEDCQKDV